jgi:hypothetical protein
MSLKLPPQVTDSFPLFLGYCQIHVSVVDVNDNAPEFGPTLGLVTLPENSPEDTVVFAKEARDLDSGLNGRVNYRLVKVTRSFLTLIFKEFHEKLF